MPSSIWPLVAGCVSSSHTRTIPTAGGGRRTGLGNHSARRSRRGSTQRAGPAPTHGPRDRAQIDAELYGLLKPRAAPRGEYLETTATLSQELHAFAERVDEVAAERVRDFAERGVLEGPHAG